MWTILTTAEHKWHTAHATAVDSQGFNKFNAYKLDVVTEALSSRLGPLYFLRKRPQCPFNRRLGRPQSRSGHIGKEKNLLSLQGIEQPFLGWPACSLLTIPTTLQHHSSDVIQCTYYVTVVAYSRCYCLWACKPRPVNVGKRGFSPLRNTYLNKAMSRSDDWCNGQNHGFPCRKFEWKFSQGAFICFIYFLRTITTLNAMHKNNVCTKLNWHFSVELDFPVTTCTAYRSDPHSHSVHCNIYTPSVFVMWAGIATRYRGWTVRGTNPGGGQIFRTCPDLLWGPPGLPYNGYRVSFPGGGGGG